jgi:alpha-N-acetylglucosaminidase
MFLRNQSLKIKLLFSKFYETFFLPKKNFPFKYFYIRYDLVDITRQCLQLGFDTVYNKLIVAYNESNQIDFNIYSKLMIQILDDMNAILSTNDNFLLGKWINSAKALANSDEVFLVKFKSNFIQPEN